MPTQCLSKNKMINEFVSKNMANTYSQIYIQLVFAVNGRQSLIQQPWKNDLYSYIGGIIKG